MTIAVKAAVQMVKSLTKTSLMRNGVPMIKTSFTRVLANGKEEMVTVFKNATTGKATRMYIEDGLACLDRTYKAPVEAGKIFSKKLGRYLPTFKTGHTTTYSSYIADGKATKKLLWSDDVTKIIGQESNGNLTLHTNSLYTNALVRTPEKEAHKIFGYTKQNTDIWRGINNDTNIVKQGNRSIDLTSGLGKPRPQGIVNDAGRVELRDAYVLPNDKGRLAILEGTETPAELVNKGFKLTSGTSYHNKFLA